MRFQEGTQEQERGRKRKGLIGTEDMVKTKREDLEKETRKEREAGKNLLEAETFKSERNKLMIIAVRSLSGSHLVHQVNLRPWS